MTDAERERSDAMAAFVQRMIDQGINAFTEEAGRFLIAQKAVLRERDNPAEAR